MALKLKYIPSVELIDLSILLLYIYIGYNHVADEGFISFTENIRFITKLQTLRLGIIYIYVYIYIYIIGVNKIGSNGMKFFAQNLNFIPDLHTLLLGLTIIFSIDIGTNVIGLAGVESLSNKFADIPLLKLLDISRFCNINLRLYYIDLYI